MKSALFIVCILAFASCSLLKRSVNERKSSTDSTAATSARTTAVVKEQTNKNRQSVTTTHKGSDSGYSRTTVIKEYSFSDEFASDMMGGSDPVPASPGKERIGINSSPPGDYFAPDPTKKRVRYRETTITETGRLQQSVQKERVAENVNGTQRLDSSVIHKHDQVQRNTSEQTTSKQTQKRKLFPGWMIGVGIFLLVLIVICWYKKSSPIQLWQSLTKRTK